MSKNMQSEPSNKSQKVSKSKKELKSDNKKLLETLVPVFNLKIADIGERVTCKCAGYVQAGDKIQDEVIDASDNDTQLKIGIYDIGYLTTHCNISGSYLIKNDKLPIYCKSVMYSRKFLSGNLFSCFLYFTLDEETKEILSDYTKYNNRLMKGKYTFELQTIDDDFLPLFLKQKREQLMIAIYDDFENADDDLRDKLMDNIENELKVYSNFFEPVPIENPRKKTILAKMDTFLHNSQMTEFIEFGLELRDKKRLAENCPDQTFERPKKVINLKELGDNPDTIDENLDKLLAEYEDSDNSE